MVALSDIGFDPITGSRLGSIGQNVIYGPEGPAEEPLGYRMLEHMPSATSAMAWNNWRASNTILSNVKDVGPKTRFMTRHSAWFEKNMPTLSKPARAISNRMPSLGDPGRMRSTFSPRYFNRMPKMSTIAGLDAAGKEVYTPFDFLSRTGNWLSRAKEGETWRPGAAKADDIPAFSSGTMARLNTMNRMQMMAPGSKRAIKAAEGAQSFLAKTNPQMLEIAKLSGIDLSDARTASHFVAASGKGTYSSQISGFIAQVGASPTEEVTLKAFESRASTPHVSMAERAGLKGFVQGSQTAKTWLGYGGITEPGQKIGIGAFKKAWASGIEDFAAKKAAGVAVEGTAKGLAAKNLAKFGTTAAARYAAVGWVPIAGQAIMTAMLVADITKMGLEAARAIPGFTRDALNSFKGGIQKPVFGTQYKDNSVAATSRQRGVMAIQNSQLNMRSVLGSEAAGLHSYFG